MCSVTSDDSTQSCLGTSEVNNAKELTLLAFARAKRNQFHPCFHVLDVC